MSTAEANNFNPWDSGVLVAYKGDADTAASVFSSTTAEPTLVLCRALLCFLRVEVDSFCS